MKSNKRKRVTQDSEPDHEEYEPAQGDETSSSEESEDSEEDEDEFESEAEGDDEDLDGVNGSSLAKGKGRASAENSFLEEDAAPATKSNTFRQKTLILSSRGITHRMRHMMKDIANLLPHSKTGEYEHGSEILTA